MHGVVHVLGSVSTLIGTPVRGGTERRPICRAAQWRNFLQAGRLLAIVVSHGSYDALS